MSKALIELQKKLKKMLEEMNFLNIVPKIIFFKKALLLNMYLRKKKKF